MQELKQIKMISYSFLIHRYQSAQRSKFISILSLGILFLMIIGCTPYNRTVRLTPDDPEYNPVADMKMLLGSNWNPPKVDSIELSKYPLGSKKNPVKTQGVRGEYNYLGRLKCQNGDKPQYGRVGSVGTGPYGYILDLYMIKCSESTKEIEVYMDLYHPKYSENKSIEGFTLEE